MDKLVLSFGTPIERADDDYACPCCGGRPYIAYHLHSLYVYNMEETLYECPSCGAVATNTDKSNRLFQ
jgi:predicted RNA-binding Zn-ribbon protein involved in translation (DUF1610 family)